MVDMSGVPRSLDTQKLSREVKALRRQLEQSASSRTYVTLSGIVEGGTLNVPVRERLTETVELVQLEKARAAPPSPRPTAPVLTVHGGGTNLFWDGRYVDADGATDPTIGAPVDWVRAEAHASKTLGFTPGPDSLLDTFESPLGGTRPVALEPGEWEFLLVVLTGSGKRSEPSARRTATVVAPVGAPEVAGIRDALADAELELVRVARQVDDELPQRINDAAASPITDARLPADGSLTRWPFATGTIPTGALEPGSVGSNDLADFSIIARKLKTNQHIIY